jgi:hypothetical protein
MKTIASIIFVILFLFPSFVNSGQLQDLVYCRYGMYGQVREIGGNNKGKDVESILKRVDLPPGQPWCMALYYTMYDDAADLLGIPNPIPKTGKVSNYWNKALKQKLTYKIILSKDVLLGAKLNKADALIFQRGKTLGDGSFGGHIGSLQEQISKNQVKAFEGNTGSQSDWDGEGAFMRVRNVPGTPSFKVLGFIRVRDK